MAGDDYCTRKVKAQYDVWPSARASQAVAKCRKSRGETRKTEEGADLRRWTKEQWVDRVSKKPCGAGGDTEYCRPSRVVSAETPTTRPSKRQVQEALFKKRAGKRAPALATPERS